MVWQKAIELTQKIYTLTHNFPKEEQFGLTSQIRRAAISVPLNIAEGQARYGKREFVQFLYFAKGSLAEIDTQLYIAQQLEYLEAQQYQSFYSNIDELQRMLFGLIAKLDGTKMYSSSISHNSQHTTENCSSEQIL